MFDRELYLIGRRGKQIKLRLNPCKLRKSVTVCFSALLAAKDLLSLARSSLRALPLEGTGYGICARECVTGPRPRVTSALLI